MALQKHNFEQPPVDRETPNRGNGMSNFLSGVAVLLSTLALVVSGFTAYQVFTLQQTLNIALNRGNERAIAPNQLNSTQATSSVTAPVSPSASMDSTASTTGIQAGQFVQNTLGTAGQVELLSVKRIKDPELGTRDVVNVQMRIRRITPNEFRSKSYIFVGDTTAQNPETSETYKAVDSSNHSTGTIFLPNIQPRSSVDAYVWLRVPEGVSTVNIFVPETGAFKNVPIS